MGRTEKEAAEARQARTELAKAVATAGKLKDRLFAEGGGVKDSRLWQRLSGEMGARNQLISQLVEARKAVTGSETEGDRAYYAEQFNTAFNRGPDEVARVIDSYIEGLQTGYQERVRSVIASPMAAAPAAPQAEAQKTPPARMSDAEKAAAMKWLRENPNDPNAPSVRALVQSAVRR